MQRILIFAAFLFLVTCTGCQKFGLEDGIVLPHDPLRANPTSYPMVVKLQAGESATLPAGEAVITFEKVTDDSRCPLGVVCVWAGDGAVKLVVQSPTGPDTTCTLHTTLEPKSVSVHRLVIGLERLDPYPEHGKEIDPSAYAATLRIDREPR